MITKKRFTVELLPGFDSTYVLFDELNELFSENTRLVLEDRPAIYALCKFLNKQNQEIETYKNKIIQLEELLNKLNRADEVIDNRIKENKLLSELNYDTYNGVNPFELCNMELIRVKEMIHK